jgi:hypothetical protein
VRGSRLLIVHSSADRYGSDIACLVVATATRDAGWHVDVLLPHDGPLVGELSAGIRAELVDSLVVRRADLHLPGVLLLPVRWLVALFRLRRVGSRPVAVRRRAQQLPADAGRRTARPLVGCGPRPARARDPDVALAARGLRPAALPVGRRRRHLLAVGAAPVPAARRERQGARRLHRRARRCGRDRRAGLDGPTTTIVSVGG